jgi:hypothetical protein
MGTDDREANLIAIGVDAEGEPTLTAKSAELPSGRSAGISTVTW